MKAIQTILCFLLFLSSSYGQYDEKHTQILMREIGNKILWSVGDSTSRVLPITKAENRTYVISFERPINIISDSLYKIVTHELKKIKVSNFLTEIKDCVSEDVILAFIHSSEIDSVYPCQGRSVPKNCYKIEVTINEPIYTIAEPSNKTITKKFQEFIGIDTKDSSVSDSLTLTSQLSSSLPNNNIDVSNAGTSIWLYFSLALGFLSILYFSIVKHKSKNKEELVGEKTEVDLISIGQYQFDPSKSKLIFNGEFIVLTEKESKLLTLLFNGLNQPQKRDDLIGEIWGEEGLLVISRNIDVLVSKLRKKLQDDPQLKITNVHGVGYKLEL